MNDYIWVSLFNCKVTHVDTRAILDLVSQMLNHVIIKTKLSTDSNPSISVNKHIYILYFIEF